MAVSDTLAIYVHYPYCTRLCPYCDFNVYRARAIDHDGLARAYKAQLGYWARHMQGRQVSSIFFGGGTPSLMPPALVEDIISTIADIWHLPRTAEISMEANPSELAPFAALRAAGVTRLSLGVQALRADRLRFLGRSHTPQQARASLAAAAQYFDRYSLDIIYATPNQTLSDWTMELRDILALEAPHYSFYALTLESGTAFARQHAQGRWAMPEESLALSLFQHTAHATAKAGLQAYELANHARQTRQYCQHNMHIWRGGAYLGIGPGAAGRVPMHGARYATMAERAPQQWMDSCTTKAYGYKEITRLTVQQNAIEAVLTGMRLAEGVSLARLGQVDKKPLAPLIAQGVLECTRTHLRASARGRAVLDSLMASIVAALPKPGPPKTGTRASAQTGGVGAQSASAPVR